MATDKRPTMLRLPESTFQKIRSLSNIEHRSMNLQIEHILESYIANYEALHGSIPVQSEESLEN